MDIKEFLPPQTISLKIGPGDELPTFIKVTILPASEKTQPGLPGKSAGQLFLLKEANDQLTLTVSTGLPNQLTADSFRQAGGALARWLLDNKATGALLDAGSFDSQGINNALECLCEGLLLAAYQFKKYKKPEEQPQCTFYIKSATAVQELQARLESVQTIVYAANLARQISHEPANVINPETLSDLARQLAAQYGLKCTILDSDQLAALNAGALLAVGQGSKTPSRLIVLEYAGQASSGTAPVVLVGKAITFDTGGYSIKTSDGVVGMKYDKSGGVTVMATLIAAASLKLSQPLVGIIPAAENMISGGSYHPDDILVSMSGKTIEIVSTDAEGRLILADALTYAQKNYKPKALIDIATLTGGVIVALGHVRAGILSNDDELFQALFSAGEATHERLWRLPLDDDYKELIKSHDADMKNSGPREASTIMGATFLQQFVEDGVKWAHVDVAGTADMTKPLPYYAQGSTAFGVRLFIEYLKNL